MKRPLFTVLSLVFACGLSTGQQLENPGFEEWEPAGPTITEPVNWSSIKSSDAGDLINNMAPVVWDQSDDAHSGNYSLELFNVQSILLATGTITNGRIHASLTPGASNSYTDPGDARWNTPLTARPDSIAVWIKYAPQGTDTAQVKAVLHVGEGTLPSTPENQGNWIGFAQIDVYGAVGEWKRVVAPFTYYSQANPEYILLVMTAGAGLQPVEGSVALFDDVQLVYDPARVNDRSLNNSLVYTSGMEIFLNNLPESFRKGTLLELFSLDGSVAGTIGVDRSRVDAGQAGIMPGLYVLRISGEDGVYSQKVSLR